jgi:hypothetical protein
VTSRTDPNAVDEAQNGGACYGCALGLAAPFFPQAAKMNLAQYGSAGSSAPKGQTTRMLASDVVYLEDPPHGSSAAAGPAVPYPGSTEHPDLTA